MLRTLSGTTRRRMLASTLPVVHLLAAPTPTDVRIVSIEPQFEEFLYRTPYMFGGRQVDRVTMLNVGAR